MYKAYSVCADDSRTDKSTIAVSRYRIFVGFKRGKYNLFGLKCAKFYPHPFKGAAAYGLACPNRKVIKMSGIYIHIPFCKQACNYCNFHFNTSLLKKNILLNALLKEIEWKANKIGVLNTIYLGGGTPSLLSVQEVGDILHAVKKCFSVARNAEITFEANPDDITIDKLTGWKAAGVNRLSIGVQSFFEEDLQWMCRAHNAVQAKQGLQLALQYFDNITIDLIYGIPGLIDEKWKQNVQTVIEYGVPHVSCYALTVEPQTPLHKLIRQRKKLDVNAADQSGQFLLLMEWLKAAGYEHYEISNFAKPGFRSRHNSSYWQGKPYMGIGPSAHSFDGRAKRTWNVANNQKYIDAIGNGFLSFKKEILTPIQKLNEKIMIALRTSEGLNTATFSAAEKAVLFRAAQKHIDLNRMEQSQFVFKLTNEGKLFADGIAADLFFDEPISGTMQ